MTHRETNNSYKILAGKRNEESIQEALVLVDGDCKILEAHGTGYSGI
jgi:hypothetical protein